MASSRVTRSASAASASNGSSPAPKQGAAAPSSIATKAAAPTKEAKKATKKRPADSAPSKPSSRGRPATDAMAPPSTPPAKKARRAAAGAAATIPTAPTPTPSISKDFAAATTVAPAPESRPADPAATNAPLSTPRGSRHTAYPVGSAPPPQYLPAPRATTENLLEKACAHLCSVEPKMSALIAAHPCPLFTPKALAAPVDPFAALVRGILAQQVSGAAAASIQRKFVALFQPEGAQQEPGSVEEQHVAAEPVLFPQPAQVVLSDVATLRTAGLSQRKAEYVLGLAQKFVDGDLGAEMLAKASWEEVLEKLTAVRGLGVWSVEMFGCFALKRMDIFSTGDLGVQRGLAAFVGRDVKKLRAKGGGKWKYMSEQDMLAHSEKFAPYRTLFMWYMWRAEDVNTDVLEGA